MKQTNLYMALALAGVCGAANAVTVDFSGYFRAGVGLNATGGNQVCFQAPGADTKWRLGNECDYVIEPTFSAKLATFEGSDWSVVFMPSAFQAYGGGNSGLNAGFGQVYAYGTKIPMLANGTVWAGRRFYNRLQLGINDQFLEIDDGDGAGVENMEIAGVQLSVGLMTDPNGVADINGDADANNARIKLPVRITGIKTVPNGELSLYVKPQWQADSSDQNGGPATVDEEKALAVGAYQTLNGAFFGGNSLFGIRYDKQGDAENTRFVVQQTGKLGVTYWDAIAQFRKHEDGVGGDNDWISIGGRTDTHLGGAMRFLFEAGHDQVKPDAGDTINMTKLTAALAFSAGADPWSRPTVRLFVTHAVWNDAAVAAGLGSARTLEVFGDKKNGTTIGAQAEAWW